jgi:hypothetical protein
MQLSGKTLSVIFVIVIPIFTGICVYVYGHFLFKNPSSVYPNSNFITLFALRAAQVCYLIIIAYALYPILFTVERLSKSNYENIAHEFEFIKKSLFVGVPVLVIVIIIARLLTYFQINGYLVSHYFILYDASFAILAASIATVIGSLLRIAVYTAKRELRFYLARGYIRISSRKENYFDKIKYLFLSLGSYNKFLIRRTKFGIKNIDRIYSEMMHTDARKNDEMIESINGELAGQAMDLATYLSKIYKVAATEQFFIKEGLVQKLKVVAAFLAAAIPIVVSIIQLYFRSA